MKILFYRYQNICERDVLRGFRELGAEVVELQDPETGNLSDTVRAVTTAVQEQAVDLVFSIDFFPMVAESCRVLRIRYLTWVVDAPVLSLYSRQIAYDCNRIFCFDSAQAAEIGAFNPGHVHYLPLAVPVEMRQEAVRACDRPERFQADISFIGSLYDEQCDYDAHKGLPAELEGYLAGVMEAGSRLHQLFLPEQVVTEGQAAAFRSSMPGFPAISGESFLTDRVVLTQALMGAKMTCMERRRLIGRLGAAFGIDVYTAADTAGMKGVRNRGLANTATEMPAVFARSKINFNQTMRGIRTGVSLRVWDILACGGFCLTDAQSDLYDLLPVGEALAVYEDEEDLMQQAAWYLTHEEERREIAAEGQRIVRERHSYPQRLLQLLETGLKE